MSMTTEQAAAWFEERSHNTPMPGARAMYEIAAAALREKADREHPKPLTIEELKEMIGEPVWLDGFEWRVIYGVSTISGSLCLATGFDCWIPLDGYGETWFAYRHKPKEGTP
jgi:hypothetical protein